MFHIEYKEYDTFVLDSQFIHFSFWAFDKLHVKPINIVNVIF